MPLLLTGNNKREGFIKFDVGGQSTIIKFEKGLVSDKFINKIAYFGKIPTDLGISITLVELDEDERAQIGNVEDVVNFAAKLPLNSFNPYIGPGSGVLSSLLKLWKVNIDDDLEAQAHGVLDCSDLKGGQTFTYTFIRSGHKVFEVEFSINDLGKQKNFKDLIISIGEPKFDIRINKTPQDIVSFLEGIAKDVMDMIINNEEEKTLTFQASSVKQSDSFTAPYNKYKELVQWEKKQLFIVPAAITDRHIAPLSLSFALVNKKSNIQEILDVVESSIDLATALGAGGHTLPEAKKLMKKENDNITSFIAEFSKCNLSLFSFNGLVFLSTDETNTPYANVEECSNGKIILKKVMGHKNLWSGTIDKEIKLKNEKIGNFKCLLEIKGI